MEHESFEDGEVAGLLNREYVAVKVDREERPDIDQVYMAVCQAMTGQGGWPLTVILTPDRNPIFAGTYFPKHSRYGRPGLMDVLSRLADKWRNDREEVLEFAERITQEVRDSMEADRRGEAVPELLDQAYRLYERLFDSEYGGFGGAPKFPSSHNLSFLLRYYRRTGEDKALRMVERTLDGMRRGGMYDHIGFGFARYSVDEQWLVPHFEKMLYDNALLAWTYLEAYQLTGKREYAETAEQIFEYVLRDMTDPEGGFYSAEDADSEGREGKFYVWRPDEIANVLGAEDGDLICEWFGITEEGNFEGDSIPNLIGQDAEAFASERGMTVEELQRRIEHSRARLYEHREKRVHPGKDDKILTAWNGLMIMALATGYKALGRERYLEAARRSADFILRKLRREDGRLLARYRDGEAAYEAYLDDYAFLVWGLIELYEAGFDIGHLQAAIELNERMIELFRDEHQGGLFFTGADGEKLFARGKEIYDGAMPSGNSVAALNLQRLARLTGDAQLAELAERQLEAFAGAVRRYPPGYAMYLIALDYATSAGGEIVIAGSRDEEETRRMIEAAHRGFRPHTEVLLAVPGPEAAALERLVPAVAGKMPVRGNPAAYVCVNFACQAPVTDAASLKALLDADR
ncbi:thioredoxin domain-containing protein [Paenibacillus cisolokensis]|uniref:Thioredoxin domain-containing protein n=1 Tax=Paenibacillus cisolokensis TaxID=1658519 RepID=A0ABQ4NFK9_9BACL|nr:thioredoxin domain-containing protein [Paenibacillus cisolokensis]